VAGPEQPRGGDQQIPRPDRWTAGGPPPWHGSDLSFLTDGAALAAALASTAAVRPTPEGESADADQVPGRFRSAVLVPLHLERADPGVVLTRRSKQMSRHGGEIAFPGGRIDAGESVVAAALRESREEIALRSDSVNVIGMLAPVHTRAGHDRITPVVGTLASGADYSVASSEVDRVFAVGLVELAESFRSEVWNVDGREIEIHFYDLDGETLWGATARIVTDLLTRVVGGDPGQMPANIRTDR